MREKSILGSGLVALFSVVAYILYIENLSSDTVIIAAFVYFFPIVVEAAEDLQSGGQSRKIFVVYVVLLIAGLAFLGVLWYCFSRYGAGFPQQMPAILSVLLRIGPLALLPPKVVPFFDTIMRILNVKERNHAGR